MEDYAKQQALSGVCKKDQELFDFGVELSINVKSKDGTEDWLVENGYGVLGALTLRRIQIEIKEWLEDNYGR